MAEEVEAGVAPAPASASESEAVGSAPDASVDDSLSTDSEAQPTASFDWDGWDGEVDTLPESAREWATPFKTHYTKGLETQLTEVEELKKLYDGLLAGHTDPRLEQMEAKIKEMEELHGKSSSEWETKYAELEKTYNEYHQQVEAAIDKEAEEYAQWFQQENTDLFENETLAEVFVGLLDEGWEMETAAEAARLPAPLLQAARQAKADGVPDAYALRIVGQAKSPAAPRPGAKLTAGATVPARSREQAMLPEKVQPTSFKDLRNQVARLALKRTS
jgi:hypothetical protein